MKAAKDIAKQVMCSTNLHALAMGSVMYAEANRGMLPPHCKPISSGSAYVVGGMSYAPIYSALDSGSRPAILLETYRLLSAPNTAYLDSTGKPVPWGPHGLLLYLGQIENSSQLFCPSQDIGQFSRKPFPEPFGSKVDQSGGYGGVIIKSSYPFNINVVMPDSGQLAGYMYTKMESFPNSAVLACDVFQGAMSPHLTSGEKSPTWIRVTVGGSASPRSSSGLYTFIQNSDTWNTWTDHIKALDYLQ